MASASDPRAVSGFGDGSLLSSILKEVQADLTTHDNWTQNRVTVVGAVAAATTAGKAKTTATAQYASGGTGYQKAATDNLWDLTAVTTAPGGFAKVLLQLDSAGAATIKKGTESTTSQAAATFPTPDANKAVVGWVQLGNSYAGGALTSSELFDGTPPYGAMTLSA